MNRREFVGGVAGSSLLGAGALASPVPSVTVAVGQPRKEKDIILYRANEG